MNVLVNPTVKLQLCHVDLNDAMHRHTMSVSDFSWNQNTNDE